jgi:hypothetical protein
MDHAVKELPYPARALVSVPNRALVVGMRMSMAVVLWTDARGPGSRA